MEYYTNLQNSDLLKLGYPIKESVENYLLIFNAQEGIKEEKVTLNAGDKSIKLLHLIASIPKFSNFDLNLKEWEDELEGLVDFNDPIANRIDQSITLEADIDSFEHDLSDGLIDNNLYFKKGVPQNLIVRVDLENTVYFSIFFDGTLIYISQPFEEHSSNNKTFAHIGFGAFPILPALNIKKENEYV